MPATFSVHGPFKIMVNGKNSRYIEVGCPSFWTRNKETDSLKHECGCYLFAVKAGQGYRPIYVGKTTKSFERECFTPHKLACHYQPALSNTRKGTAVMFFVILKRGRGRANRRAISEVESFLIQNALKRNPDLSNIIGTREHKWTIAGVIRGGQGQPSHAAKEFCKAMGI